MTTIDIGFDPNIFAVGPFVISWHGVLTSLAVLTATTVGFALAQRRGISSRSLDTVMFWVLICGIVGARLFHVLDHLSLFAAEPLLALAFWTGGIAVYGSFIGGLLGGAIAARHAGLPVRPLLDVAAPAMLVGQIIGRLGCLSNGDAWGAPCLHPAGICVTYLNPNDLVPPALIGVPTYPYPLYEMAANAVLLLGLWLARRHPTQAGTTFWLATIGYGLIRFTLTFLRQEPRILWGLQEAQLVALVTIGAASIVLAQMLRNRNALRKTSDPAVAA